jgi:hypothetical protein
MSRTEIYLLAAVIALFIFGSVWMFMALHYRERRKRDAIKQQPIVSPEVRSASHGLSNEATKLRAGLKRISESPDPIRALVEAMAGHRHGRDH